MVACRTDQRENEQISVGISSELYWIQLSTSEFQLTLKWSLGFDLSFRTRGAPSISSGNMQASVINLHRANLDLNSEIIEYLHSNIQALETVDRDGNTPLLFMCKEQSWKNAEIFIEMGCDINAVNRVNVASTF